MDEAKRARELLGLVSQALAEHKKKGYLLDLIAWPREVEEKFFAAGASRLPEIEQRVDREGRGAIVADLERVARSIDGDEPVAEWLRRVVDSKIAESRMLLAAGTAEFTERSRELYGGARTAFYAGKATNLDLADHLMDRLAIHGWDEAGDREETPLGAEQFGQFLGAHVEKMRPRMDVEIVVDPTCTAKVLAGMKRVRIRPDATFARWEAEGLWHHEVETHVLTAQNGAAQAEAPFLSSGGPRTTRTQEGLAVFSELYNRVLTVRRIERLAVRVKLVDMAEQGASFLDLYRYLVERGSAPRDAYLDAQRVCRGGKVEGGAPFTKDACYLSGLLHVYAFLNVFVRGGFRDETELLVSGRIDLDDVAAIVKLRGLGVLSRPKYRPRWLRNWDTLLPYFAFASFMSWIDLTPVEAHYAEVISLAEAASPRS
ncbi:MAG: flavohemoglobin expression-modulating QEGLA motif protein [Minicystis sp.]